MAPIAAPIVPSIPTPLPVHLRRSPVMIASLPSIYTTLDGGVRQFYGRSFPTRRVALP